MIYPQSSITNSRGHKTVIILVPMPIAIILSILTRKLVRTIVANVAKIRRMEMLRTMDENAKDYLLEDSPTMHVQVTLRFSRDPR